MAGCVAEIPFKAQHSGIKVHPCNYNDDGNPQLCGSAPANQHESGVTRFIVIVAFLLVSTLTVSAITFSLIWFSLRQQTPTLSLDSLSTPKFDTSDNYTLTAIYDIGFTYNRANCPWKIYFEEIEVSVFYKSYILARETVQELLWLGMEREKSVNAMIEDGTQWFSGDPESQEIRRDREKGMMSFNVSVRATVIYEGLWWKDNRVLVHSCSDLQIAFSNTSATGTGSLIGDVPRNCY
ncbi:uncharacterized protein LOC133853963 [Alnus glutinosa]|uniref:uncharacterized protein LOC133853963 n=1 Tax=Alnus glutinosa TaxID=3517 RepID=UPI002D78CC42|nr:uncharacterized protein LOC133853963 [Alnus glutinosa]